MNRRAFIAAPVLILAGRAIGAAAAAGGYPPVTPGRVLAFPRDQGSHPEFRTEWWYITGWVADAGGARYGVQVTFFRNRPRVAEGNPSAFAPRQLLFAHAALADPRRGRLRHDQRAARAGFGLAGADEESTRAWIDDWSLVLSDGVYARRSLRANSRCDCASRQRSHCCCRAKAAIHARGRIRAGKLLLQPAAARGDRRDHRRGSRAAGDRDRVARSRVVERILMPGAVGWDWAGVNLADGGALMAFRIRDSRGVTLWAGGRIARRAAMRAPSRRSTCVLPRRVSGARRAPASRTRWR